MELGPPFLTDFVLSFCFSIILLSQSIDIIRDKTGTQASFLIATALAFGLGITVLVYTIAPISGGHINPAVTTALMLLGDISPFNALAYIGIQMMAAVLGASIVWGSMKNDITRDIQGGDPPFLIGVNALNSGTSNASAFLLEMLGTYLLMITVCMTAVSKNSIAGNVAPIAIGLSVLLAHLTLIPFTGCGINPARVFGPMVIIKAIGLSIDYHGWWVYYTAPFVGSALAAGTYKFVFTLPEDVDEAEAAAKVLELEEAVDEGKGVDM
jgi:MIP family channel proteins